MTNERFKRFIENILKNENIRISPASAFYNFNDVGENWCKDWTTIFKKILNDIKAGKNYEMEEIMLLVNHKLRTRGQLVL